jgi:galactokinase
VKALCLKDLLDAPATAAMLTAAGHRQDVAAGKAERFGTCARALALAGADSAAEVHAFFVPGRVEVLGKHTDYAGGRSILAAVERGICLVAAARPQAKLHVQALDVAGQCEFDFSGELAPPVGHWSNYPMTVARRVARNFPGPLRGAMIAYSSDLPPAAGMSSSSTVMVATFLALSAINRLAERAEYRREIDSAESLAGYLGTIENGQNFGALAGDKGVGTFGGSEDHVAMLCGQAGTLCQYAYCPVRLERRIALPAGWTFAIASSGVIAAKTGEAMAKYNLASALARAVVAAWNVQTGRSDPHIAAALASQDLVESSDRMRRLLLALPANGPFAPKDLWARFEHFLAENEQIIPPAGAALADGAVAEFGRFADSSQHFAEKLLGNQVPETIFLAHAARQAGAAAASAFGAGFGGSVWALVQEGQAPALLDTWRRNYEHAFPEPATRASFFATRCGPAAFELVARGE